MTIAPGTRLGPYEMLAPIGAGGMGEVWRARDGRLDRSVAVKILPAAFSSDEVRRLRFEREAKVISQINHPNICAVYDVGHDSGTDYLVMELIDGETLADRLARSGALPLPEVNRYGAQIADALHAAHRSGIVHRDLKPGNVMLTRSGAKLLDFGLARPRDIASNSDGPTEVVTAQKPLTEEGTIVGTIQYMSPEQLTGAPTDHRSDLFALGAVLYEMATGRRAFSGSTRTSVASAIISSQPASLATVQPLAPRGLERVIAACLTKEPDERIQSAHDVALQLRWMDGGEDLASKPVTRRAWIPWAIAALATFALIALLLLREQPSPTPVVYPMRFTLSPPPETNFLGIPAISPDGTKVVLNAQGVDGKAMLWLRMLDRLEAQPLKGTEGASFAFWSPDGRQIGFVARQKLWRYDTADATIHALADLLERIPGGATWNRNDVIIFSTAALGQLHRVSAAGGESTPLAKAVPGEAHAWPWFLPDDDHFLFRVGLTKNRKWGIYVGSLSSPEVKLLIPLDDIGFGRVEYAAGYLFYNRGPELYAQKFDVKKLEVTGEPQKLYDDVEFHLPGRSAFAVSSTGTLVFHPDSDPVVHQLTYLDRTGREVANAGPVASYSSFRLSPDERCLVYMRWGGTNATWMLDLARGVATRTSFERWSGFPIWLRDGRGFVYAAAAERPPNLFLRRDSGAVERLTTMELDHYPSDVTPDGKYVMTELNNPPNGLDIVAVPLASPRTPVPVVATRFDDRDPMVSPDGRWLAYQSNESGEWQIYVTRLFAPGNRVQMSTEGGQTPRWSRDGRHLYYVDRSHTAMMEVAVSATAEELQPSAPQRLFSFSSSDYDVTRDGRFLIAKPQLNRDAAPLTVVMNAPVTLR